MTRRTQSSLELLLLFALFLAVKARPARTSVPPPTSLQSCGQSLQDTTGWHRVTANIAPVSLLVPPGLHEFKYGTRFSFTNRPGTSMPSSLPVATQFWRSSNHDLDFTLMRFEWPRDSAPPPWLPDMRATDVTECRDTVDGRPIVVRTYRALGMIYHDNTPLQGYAAEAALDLAPTVRIVLSSAHPTPALQAQTLATIRSIRVLHP